MNLSIKGRLPLPPHDWSGPHGVPGGLERWEHGSYRWRRALEAAAAMIAIIILAPWSVEIVAGAGLMGQVRRVALRAPR